ncbi:hypothetical protein GS907_24520 [Rhodococcus hoagii]|nr:hypothetical protein [Prescottella equi]
MEFAKGGRIELSGVGADAVPIPLEPGCPPYVIPASVVKRYDTLLGQLNDQPTG